MGNTTFLNPQINGDKLIIDVVTKYQNGESLVRQMTLQLPVLYEISVEIDPGSLADAVNGLIYAYARLATFVLNSEDEHSRKELLGADDEHLYHLNLLSRWLRRMDSL